MNTAKKISETQKSNMFISHDEDNSRRLEQRYSLDYKSIASSAIRQSDTSALESLVSQIESEEIPKDSILDSIAYHASSLLEQIGYTNSIIESRSKRKLKKAKSNLLSRLNSTDEQLLYLESSINQIDNYISQSLLDLDTYQNDLVSKTTNLKKFKQEISEYETTTKKSLNPKEKLYLDQAKLDYQIESSIVDDLQKTCDVSFLMIQEYYAQKSQDISMKSVFEADKIVLQSLHNKLYLEIERRSHNHPIHTLSLNRSQVNSAYKLQDSLLDKDAKYVSLFNKKISSLPSIKDMSLELYTKRKSVPGIKR